MFKREIKLYCIVLYCNVVEIWTSDIECQLDVDPETKAFFENFVVSEPLEPRQAFFGGRTNVTHLFYDAKQDEKIRYVDFCSLYPWHVSFLRIFL